MFPEAAEWDQVEAKAESDVVHVLRPMPVTQLIIT